MKTRSYSVVAYCNQRKEKKKAEEMALSSMTWAYARIIAGTLLGGTLGFYVMHRVEVSYKVCFFSLCSTKLYWFFAFFFFLKLLGFTQMKMEEALRQYEKDMKKRQDEENLGHISEDSV